MILFKLLINAQYKLERSWVACAFDPEDGDFFIACTCGITCTMYTIAVLVQSIVVKFEHPIVLRVTVTAMGYNDIMCSRSYEER